MNQPQILRADLPDGFDLDKVEWRHFAGDDAFDYPIDYALGVVSADPAAGRIDFLARWAPNAYCHYHRHLGHTETLLVAGEQHLVEQHAHESVHKIRKAGFRGITPDGETHMEFAGPNGLTILFSVYAEDGRLFELLDRHDQVIAIATIDDLVQKRLGTAA